MGETGFALSRAIFPFESMNGVGAWDVFPFLIICQEWKSSELKFAVLLYFDIEAKAAIFSIFVAVLCQFDGISFILIFFVLIDDVSSLVSSFTFPLESEFLEEDIFWLLLKLLDLFGFCEVDLLI